jgi:phosphohistidine swiveling domain-containing protein
MSSKWPFKKIRCLLPELYVVLLLLASAPTYATTVAEESELKAAFVYNFTLFTTWPQANNPLSLCVLGESTYLPLLKVYDNRVVNGSTMKVKQVDSASEALSCQVLFIDAIQYKNINTIHHALEGASVLTVTESNGITPHSVIIAMMANNGRIQFEIDNTEALNSGLNFSYKLLKLARKVH